MPAIARPHYQPRQTSTAIAENSKQDEKQDKKKERRARRSGEDKSKEKQAPEDQLPAQPASGGGVVDIAADRQQKAGDVYIYEGYVNAVQGETRLQADRVTYNSATGDMTAEGNVIYDEGADQRVTARRAELNWVSKRGTFRETTGFTNRTQTGDYVFFTAARVDKTGADTYELYDAQVTACEDLIPKWSFNSKRAELKIGDRVTLHNAVFRVKSLPAFVLPYAWIPATRNERKSGFLLPSTGSSNQKGRTLKAAYYQTLGQSADITFRGDVYTERGLGFGAEFRAQTDERSYFRLGVFTVKDRLFGPPGEDQGGTAFVGEGIQYLPHGWLAVGNISLVSSLSFRQVFSDDIRQVIDPRRESTLYVNNNSGNVSLSFLASKETTTLFRPSQDPLSPPGTGANIDVQVRQAPEFDMTVYPRSLFGRPIYFSFDASVGALKREEIVDDVPVLVTPAVVQRLDFQPKITVPLATFLGTAITPSASLRETFYSSSVNTLIPPFNPENFATSPTDPRLDPNSPQFNPAVKLFTQGAFEGISTDSVRRQYAEIAVDVRPPSLEKTYTDDDGQPLFKHVIEPYLTYRLIKGVGDEFNRIIRFDDRDAVANTNEIEYSVVNRFFIRHNQSDLNRRRSRRRGRVGDRPDMTPVRPADTKPPENDQNKDQNKDKNASGAKAPSEQNPAKAQADQPTAGEAEKPQPKETPAQEEKKTQLETGKSAALGQKGRANTDTVNPADQRKSGIKSSDATTSNDASTTTVEDSPDQAHELLDIKLTQKYFFDQTFGGALVDGQRNQFYPINTLSGFTYGGRARSFSPVNVAVRYSPLSTVYADMRMDVGSDDGLVRNLSVGGGVRKDKIAVSVGYYLSRRIRIDPHSFEVGTFPGNQLATVVQFGDEIKGFYGGASIAYDFTDRVVSSTEISNGRLRYSRSYVGWGWDCCGVQFNYNTFKAGLRNESAFSFTFTLAGLGAVGTDQLSQLGGGSGGRKRGKRRQNQDDDLP